MTADKTAPEPRKLDLVCASMTHYGRHFRTIKSLADVLLERDDNDQTMYMQEEVYA